MRSQMRKKFEKMFCFVQLENGTVAYVLHARNDDVQVLNIKKAIASLFQVSLEKGEHDVEEKGSTNEHTAHYRYSQELSKAYSYVQYAFAVLKKATTARSRFT